MNSIKLRLGDLRDAAGKYGKFGGVRGAKTQVIRNTELLHSPGGVSIFTPHVETGLQGEGSWSDRFSVDTKKFSAMLEELKKKWADIGGDNANIELRAENGTVAVIWTDGKLTRRQALPAYPARD